MANQETDKQLAPISPTGQAVLTLPPWLAVALTILGALVAAVPSIVAAGVALPAWVTAVAATLGTLLGLLGISSAGARK